MSDSSKTLRETARLSEKKLNDRLSGAVMGGCAGALVPSNRKRTAADDVGTSAAHVVIAPLASLDRRMACTASMISSTAPPPDRTHIENPISKGSRALLNEIVSFG